MSSRNRGFILADTLIAAVIVTLTAVLCAAAVRSAVESHERISRKMEENDRRMRNQFSREEECGLPCGKDTDGDSF